MCSWGKFSSCSPQQTVLISFPILQVAAVLIYNGQRNYAALIPASLHCLMRVRTSLTTPHFFILIKRNKKKTQKTLHILFIGTLEVALLQVQEEYFYIQSKTGKLSSVRGLEMWASSHTAHTCALGRRTHAAHTPHIPHTLHTHPSYFI